MSLDQLLTWATPTWALLVVLVGVYVVTTIILATLSRFATLSSFSDKRRVWSIVVHLLTLGYLATWMIVPAAFTIAATVMVAFDLGGSVMLTLTSAVFSVVVFVVGAKIAQVTTETY